MAKTAFFSAGAAKWRRAERKNVDKPNLYRTMTGKQPGSDREVIGKGPGRVASPRPSPLYGEGVGVRIGVGIVWGERLNLCMPGGYCGYFLASFNNWIT